MFLRHLSIASRAAFCFALVTLIVLILGIFSLLRLGDLYQAEQNIEVNWMPSVKAVEEMQGTLMRIRLESLRLLAEQNGSTAPSTDEFENSQRALREALDQYKERYLSDGDEKQVFSAVQAALGVYLDGVERFAGLIQQNRISEALRLANGELRGSAENAGKALEALTLFNDEGARRAGLFAASTYQSSRIAIISTILVAMLLTVILAVVLTRSIVRPLATAVSMLETISTGDLTRPIVVEGKDEPARLLAAGSKMQDNLRQAMHDIADASTRLASASQQIVEVTTESTQAMQTQNAQIEQAATAVNEMSAAVEEVSRNASAASDSARSSNASAKAGSGHVSRTVQAIQQLSVRIAETSDQVEGLAGQARDISKVLDVIRGVAEQTNLLALNAAIEAARAGEQGRGFAVVADEVRALAHRTANSTQEIEQMIQSIQGGSEGAMQAMQASSQDADHTLQMADEASRSLESIVLGVSDIDERNLQIASASEEQAHVAREVDQNLVNIRDLSLQSASSADQTAAACGELSHLASGLQGLVGRFRLS